MTASVLSTLIVATPAASLAGSRTASGTTSLSSEVGRVGNATLRKPSADQLAYWKLGATQHTESGHREARSPRSFSEPGAGVLKASDASASALQRADRREATGAGNQPGTVSGSEADPVAYWKALAGKRLRFWRYDEKRIVKLRRLVHKLRARGSSSTRSHPRGIGSGSGNAPASIPHYSGWLCIHSREGAWNANTGNGFYGGLQMTYGWMGLVTRADLLSPEQQMRAAEMGYRRSGYSDSWMRGQWPNTYPPCAGRF